MKSPTVLTLVLLLLLNCNLADAKSWRGIEPLHSTRADVERIMGSQVVRCSGSACLYELAEGTVFILYASDSSCKNDDSASAWRVPVGTVIEIGIHFKEEKELGELEFDLSKFKKIEDKHLPGWIYYVNLDEGIRVEAGLKTAKGITYFQSAKDNYLRCPSTNVKPSSTNPAEPRGYRLNCTLD